MRSVIPMFLCGIFSLQFSVAEANACVDSEAKSCGECMEVAGCGWCKYPLFANNPNVIKSRCDLPENLIAGDCPVASVINPLSYFDYIQNGPHSSVGELAIGGVTQLRPQMISVKLRPGSAADVVISYKQVEDYPVDMYFLFDLSSSMSDEVESLQMLSKYVGRTVSSITRDFRLGFGSFGDKKVGDPCPSSSPCEQTSGFSNGLSLSPDINMFLDAVKYKLKYSNYSSDLDSPKWGSDAMMQAILCESEIGWRRNAVHLMIYVADDVFRYAADSTRNGSVTPNDGYCHLNERGEYYKTSEMDYPSIEQLAENMKAYKIRPIFAVTDDVIETYKNLTKLIPRSIVGKLNPSNVINLIQEVYDSLIGQVVPFVEEVPDGVAVLDKQSHCTTGNYEGFKCDDVKVGDVVNFTLSIKSDRCLEGMKQMKVVVLGHEEEVLIYVSTLCDCQCDDIVDSPSACSGRGVYECGACVCDPYSFGLDCSCDERAGSAKQHIESCTEPGEMSVCSDRGECSCGQCICRQFPSRKIDGLYCECDNTTCDVINGQICNGHGTCDCGICSCENDWSGTACECSEDESTCTDPDGHNSEPCNGNGECKCGQCECGTTRSGYGYGGLYCQISPLKQCRTHVRCVECMVYGDREKFEQNPTKCDEDCENYNISLLDGRTSPLRSGCKEVDSTTNCTFKFWYEKEGDTIFIDTDPNTQICPAYVMSAFALAGTIAAVVGSIITIQSANLEMQGRPFLQNSTYTYNEGNMTSQP